jgi:shikimate dehydrogenase
MTITASTSVAAVIGWPVEHSMSPALHNAAFAALGIDAIYTAAAVHPDGLAEALAGMRELGYLGASVTVPHKQATAALCDRLAEPANRIGAVNCVCFTEDGLVGHNTDAGGFVDALLEAGGVARGARVVLLGNGGAALAVAAGLREAGCGELSVIARSPSRPGNDLLGDARPWTTEVLDAALPQCDLLVDCTSAGLDPSRENSLPAPIPLERLNAAATVCSLVYHRTPALLAAAQARGLRTVDGMGMLVHQGARAFRLWTGQAAPLDAMWAAMRAQVAASHTNPASSSASSK